MVELHTQLSLAKKLWFNRRRISEFSHLYIPVKIVTSTTRNNKKWYWVKYLDIQEVKDYIKKSWKSKK